MDFLRLEKPSGDGPIGPIPYGAERPVTHGAFLDLPKWGRKICGVGGFFEKWEKIGEESGKGYENLGFN
jgi:hypothetical protein